MKLLSRQELQNQLTSQKQVSLDRLSFIDEQIQEKVKEFTNLDLQYEDKKARIERDYESILASMESKKAVATSDLAVIEAKKAKLEAELAEYRIVERDQELRSKMLDLEGKEADHLRREDELAKENKEYAVKMAALLQSLVDVEGKKAELIAWEESMNRKYTDMQDAITKEESRIAHIRTQLSEKEDALAREYDLLKVEQEMIEKRKKMTEDGYKELEDRIKKYQSQANTLESLYLELKGKGLI